MGFGGHGGKCAGMVSGLVFRFGIPDGLFRSTIRTAQRESQGSPWGMFHGQDWFHAVVQAGLSRSGPGDQQSGIPGGGG